MKLTTYPEENGQHIHRTIMERKLGRKLESGELVHHMDENKHNFHPDNLELTDASTHASHHFSGVVQSEQHVKKRVAATAAQKANK